VELHGGTVEADSPGEGKGATFTVALPILPSSRRPAGAERGGLPGEPPGFETASAAENHTILDGIRMLVVEDIADDRETLVALFERSGAHVSAAASAREAEKGSRVPALALTAYVGPGDRQKALAAGFDTHVGKPAAPAELVAIVAALARSGQRKL
jgi:CheY-like chemotaxis protein